MRLLCILIAVLSLSSCATMIHGKHQEVTIQTEPPGASVLCDGEKVGNTPVVVTVARKQDHSITVVKNGYHQQDIDLKRRLSATTLLYALPGGVVWFSIDNQHGAQFEFEEKLKLRLKPLFHPTEIIKFELKVMKSITKSFAKRLQQFSESQLARSQKLKSSKVG